ncbi:MAG: peptidoglycan bridge formation glycyltransferase FemA/FemB family protein [Litorilinea sp.]
MTIATKDSVHAPTLHTPRAPAAQSNPHTNIGDWDTFVQEHPYGQLLQLRAWRALKGRFGWTSGRVTVPGPIAPLGGAEILYRRALGLLLAYVPRGPVVDWDNPMQTALVVQALEDAARAQGAAVLKLEPPMLDSLAARAQLSALGYTPSLQTVQPPSTIRVSLQESDDAILQRMKSKWRYNIRLAQRKGVTVRAANAEDLPTFNALMAATGARDGFFVHSADYYAAAFELLVPAHAVFLLAEYEGKPLAAIVVAHAGDSAIYLWGASNNEERNRMPNHALQWAGMQWAKARGARWYDLWGVPDAIGLLALGLNRGQAGGWPADDLPLDMETLPMHDLWGVYRFKQGFGGEAIRYVGTWDKPLQPVGAQLYHMGLQARTWIQDLRATEDKPGQIAELARALAAPLRPSTTPAATPSNPPAPESASSSPKPSDSAPSSVTPSGGTPSYISGVNAAPAWRAALAHFAAPHVLQSWEWGAIKAQTGWTAHRVTWTRTATGRALRPDAAFQLLRRRFVPGLPWSIGYVPKGPVTDWDALENPDALLAALEQVARRLGCIFVKIDPDVRIDTPAGQRLQTALKRRAWRYSPNQIQFQNTAYSFLTQDAGAHRDEDALLANMKSKWRYNVRLAQRRGIEVRTGSVVDLPLFYGLYAQTGARDDFLVRPYGYYLETWRAFLQAQAEPDNPAGGALLLAHHADEIEPVAGIFLMRYGKRAWYFYGASSERRRRDMPNYLLQWEALRWSLAQGCTVYDWWGAPTDPEDPADSMQGVWQFKQGFGAELQPHIGAWDFPVYPPAYALFTESLPQALGLLRRLRG